MTSPAPAVEFARKGANPTLMTIELIRGALRQASGPMSRNRLLESLSEWGHGTSRQALNAALRFLMADGVVIEGSKGLQYLSEAQGLMLETILRKRSR
jgi:hypothetical protein